MKEYIGLTSWLESKFVERVISQKLSLQLNTAVSVPGLDDASSIEFALNRYNDLLGEERFIPEPTSRSGYRKVGQPYGKNWNAYEHFVIPVNTGAAHNEAIILFPGTNKAIFIDPMGGGIPGDRRKELAQLGFTNILSTKQVQKDGYRCGDYTVSLVDRILSEDDPSSLDQSALDIISQQIKQLDNATLNLQRASYIQHYVNALEEDPLITTEQRQVIVSDSLSDQIALLNDQFYSVFVTTASDVAVSEHDRDARFRDSLIYRQYLSGSLSIGEAQSKLRRQGVDEEFIIKVEDTDTKFDFDLEILFDEMIIVDAYEVEDTVDRKSLMRQQKVAKLEKEIQSLQAKALQYSQLIYDAKKSKASDRSLWPEKSDAYADNCLLRQHYLKSKSNHIGLLNDMVESFGHVMLNSDQIDLNVEKSLLLKRFSQLAEVFPKIVSQLKDCGEVAELDRLIEAVSTPDKLTEGDLKKIQAIVTGAHFDQLVNQIKNVDLITRQVNELEQQIRKALISSPEFIHYRTDRQALVTKKSEIDITLMNLRYELSELFQEALKEDLSQVKREKILPMLNGFIQLEATFKPYIEDITDTLRSDEAEGLQALFQQAKELQVHYQKYNELVQQREERKNIYSDFQRFKDEKLGLGVNFHIINGLVNNAYQKYKKESDKKAEQKFGVWLDYSVSVYESGIENLTIKSLAKALFDVYNIITDRKGVNSKSEKYLLEQLASIGIRKEHLVSFEGLVDAISKLNMPEHKMFKQASQLANVYFDRRIELPYKAYMEAEKLLLDKERSLLDLEGKNIIQLNKIRHIVDNEVNVREKLLAYNKARESLQAVTNDFDKLNKGFEVLVHNGSLDDYAEKSLQGTLLELDHANKALNQLAIEDFNQRIKPLLHTESSTDLSIFFLELERINMHISALTHLSDEGVESKDKVLFGQLKLALLKRFEQFDNFKYEIAEKYERCKDVLAKDEKNFYATYQDLNQSINQVSGQMVNCQREVSKLVCWLTTHSSQAIHLPDDIILDFSGMDLRHVDLSKIKNAKGGDYDFSQVSFNNTVLGSISSVELETRLVEFRKVFNTPIDLKAIQSKQTLESEADALKLVIAQWNQNFPFLAVLDESEIGEINAYLELLYQKVKKNQGFSTNFANHMEKVNFRQASFSGKVGHSGVIFSEAKMPNKLSGIDLSDCNLSNTNFHQSMIDETTRLNHSVNNLGGAILKPTKGHSISLAGYTFDGRKEGMLPRDLRGVDLTGATISNLDLSKYIIDKTTILNNVTFNHVRFDNCQINDVNFSNCTFNERCSFRSNITDGQFNNCQFDSVNFGNYSQAQNFTISANFNHCHFKGSTNIWSGCDFTNSQFNEVHLDDLYIGDIRAPISGKKIVIDNLSGRHLDQVGDNNIWLNNRATQINNITAKQFISQLTTYMSDLKQAGKSASSIRSSVKKWVTEVVKSSLNDVSACNEILTEFNQWKLSTSNVLADKENPKWRLFNSYTEGKFLGINKGKVSEASVGGEIYQLIKQKSIQLQTSQKISDRDTYFLSEDQYIPKMMTMLLSGVDAAAIQERGFRLSAVENIERIRKGEATFDRKSLQRFNYFKANPEEYKDLNLSELREFVKTDLSEVHAQKKNYMATLKLLQDVLTYFPERIDQAMSALSPLELLHLSNALITLDAEGVGSELLSSEHKDRLIPEQFHVENTLAEFLKDSIEMSLSKMKKAEKAYFLQKFIKTPLTDQAILSQESIKNYLDDKIDARELVDSMEFPPINKFNVINELLLNFDNQYVFHQMKDIELHNQIAAKFIQCFDIEKFKEQRFSDVVKYFGENTSLSERDAKAKVSRLFKQFDIGKNPLSVNWPVSLNQDFEGCESYDQLSGIIASWARNNAEKQQINSFVSGVIYDAVRLYYKEVKFDREKVNKRLEGIASIDKKNHIHINIVESEKRLLNLSDLNQILAKLKGSRFISSVVNRSEKAFKAAIEEHSSTARNHFRPISGKGDMVITTEGDLKTGLSVTQGFLTLALSTPKLRETSTSFELTGSDRKSYSSERTQLRVKLSKLNACARVIESNLKRLGQNYAEIGRYESNIQRLKQSGGLLDSIIDFIEDNPSDQELITRNKQSIGIVRDSIKQTIKRLSENIDKAIVLFKELNQSYGDIFTKEDFKFLEGCKKELHKSLDLENINMQAHKIVKRITSKLDEIGYDRDKQDIREPVNDGVHPSRRTDKLFMVSASKKNQSTSELDQTY
ncbi:hypothetical protein L3V83_01435 [Thiotrichales bacterium 19X7-9]|nr:hypothetical protein [Thiotrichales bacterium 19X7-9]